MGLHESIRLLLCVACVVFAATQTPSVGYSVVALQAALSGYSSGDTVVLTNGGTWTGCGSAVWKVPSGKQLTFVGQGTGTHFECAYYQDGSTGQASFINMIFDNGPGQTYGDKGGVATIISGHTTFADCTFNANVVSGSAGGGHIKACTSSVNVTRCTLQGGGANVGGSIFAESVTTLIIADSVFINNVAATYGGAVYIDCSPFDVRNTAFTSNTGKYGGAFALDGSDQSSLVQSFSQNVRFVNNRATFFGGAVWFCLGVQTSPVAMTDTLFLGNEITYDPIASASASYDSLMSYSASYEPDDIQPEGSGGALFTGLRIDMTRVNFTANQAFLLGSGVYAYGSGSNPANMWTDVTFWRNAYSKPQKPHSSSEYTYWEVYRYYWYLRSIDAFGGGAFVTSYDITALRLKASNNVGTAGGAIYAYKSTFSCDGCQFTSNTATFTYGGALAMDTSTLILNNSLFEFNYCGAYGGGAIFLESGIGLSTMTSVTFRNNSVAPALSFGGGSEYDTHGGAILATTQHRKAGTGRLALVGCTFFGNSAYAGGAMRFEYSFNPTNYQDYILTVDSCRFEANYISADGYYWGMGGGIDMRDYFSDGLNLDQYVLRARITNSSFVGNIGGRRPYISGQAGTVIASYGAGSAIGAYINTRLTIYGCTFTDNIASGQGTVYLSSSDLSALSQLTISNSTFLRNTADRYGGGIAADYTIVDVSDTRIEDNVLSGVHPLGNYHGAGMYLDCYTTTQLTRVTFTHNTNLKGNGGAIAARGYYEVTVLNVDNCPFRNNAAQSGGAISMQTETYGHISNAVFDSNEASADGGAFYSSDWISFTCEFNNVNVTRNRAGSRGGGIFLSNGDLYYYSSSSSSFNVAHMNTVLVRGNTAQQGGGIFTEIGMSMEYVDLVENNAVSGWGGGMFAGGYSNVFYTDASVRNNSAGVAGGGIYAIGEYSFSGSFAPATVDVGNVQLTHNSAASGGAIFIDKEASVSIAINSVFEFNAGLGAAIRGDSFSSLSIYDSIVRNHVGSQATISLSGGYAQLTNVAIRDNAARSGGVVTLIDNNFCGTNVNLDNNTSPVSDGGALFAQNSYVLLDASFITRNKGIDGGAIYATSDSEVDITNTLLSGNVAQQTGGAISVATSTVCLTGCTVHDNVAASGGAIAVGTKASLELSWSTVSHNSASKEGGAVVFPADTTLSASDSVLSANTAGTGGAVSVNGLAVVTLSNLTMNDNLATAEGGSLAIANIRSLDMHNCWVANSRGSSGGSISFSSPQDARIVNTTFHASTATGAPGADRRGGAIFCRGTNVHRVSLEDTDIEVSTAGSGRGGAIAVQGCRLSVARGSISLCTAASGGGLDYEGDASLDGFVQAIITEADFLFNQANADGGALWGEWGAVNISDSTFTSNTAGGRGGVAYFASNDPAAASQIHSSVRSSHMTGNSAGQAGGAIFFDLVDVSVGAQETYDQRGNDFSTNTVAAGGYGNDVASPLATLAWENPPKDTVYSGEPLGTVPTGGSSPVVTILVRDLFGQPATQGGTLLSISLEQHATDAVILGATLTTVLDGRVSYSGLLFLTETPGVYTVTVGTATASTIVPLRVNVTATACPADYALTDRQLQFRVCQAPECAAGTFGTPGACYPCPAGTANAFVGQVSCSACPPGRFSDSGALACSTCPSWASCDAGVPIRRAGWWADETGAAYKCEITAACPGGDVALTTCAPGYEGYLCGKCVSEGDVTYGRQFGACIQCWNRAASIVVVCIYVLVVIGAIGFLIWKASGTAHADASSVMAKIILSYLQMLNIVSNFNTYQDSPLPEISIFTQAATPTSTILPVSCALGYSFYSLLYFTLFIPLVAVGFLAGFWCVLYLIKGSRRPNAREHYFDRFICSVIVIMFIAYPTVTATSLKVFDCRSSSDTGRLRADPEITCYQGGHYVAAVFGALGVVGYGIGIPVWTYHILRKNKDTLETERNRKRYNFLFEGFRGGFAAWSVVVIVRKSLLVALQVFAGTSPSIQVTLGILLVATYAVMHAKTEPYAFPNLNRAEMVGLFTMFVVLVGGVPTVSGFDAKEYGIVVLLIGLAGVAAAVALGMFMLLTRLVVNRRIHHNRVEQVELSSIPEGTLVGAGAFGDAESGPVVTVLTVTATYDRVRSDLDKVPTEYNDLAAPINEAIPPIITVLNYMTDGKAKGVAASALQAILVDARDFARRASGGGGGPLGETSTLSAHPSVVAENGSMGGATGSVISQGGLMGEGTQDPTSGGGDMSALLLTPPPPSARVAGEAGRETAAIRALGERVVARLRTFDADYLAPKRT